MVLYLCNQAGAYLQVIGVIVAVIVIALFISTRFWCTATNAQSKPSSNLALRQRCLNFLSNGDTTYCTTVRAPDILTQCDSFGTFHITFYWINKCFAKYYFLLGVKWFHRPYIWEPDNRSRSTKLAHIYVVDLVQFLSDWLTYAADNVKTKVPQRFFKNACFSCQRYEMLVH